MPSTAQVYPKQREYTILPHNKCSFISSFGSLLLLPLLLLLTPPPPRLLLLLVTLNMKLHGHFTQLIEIKTFFKHINIFLKRAASFAQLLKITAGTFSCHVTAETDGPLSAAEMTTEMRRP